MSILIKGIKMPAKGEYELLLFCHSDGTATLEGFSTVFEGEPFEVIEVLTPHGRLKDVDELKEWIEAWFTMHRGYHPYSKSNLIPSTELIDIIDRLPTIIEAEGEAEE